jgi:hypothetical protein
MSARLQSQVFDPPVRYLFLSSLSKVPHADAGNNYVTFFCADLGALHFGTADCACASSNFPSNIAPDAEIEER